MNADPQSVHVEFIRPVDQGKTGTMQTLPLAVYLLKLPSFSQEIGFVKVLTGQRLCRQPFTPFCPASIDHRTATPGAHSLTETMGTLTLQITWLKSPFAHCIYILF